MHRKYQIAVLLACLISTIGQLTLADHTKPQDAFFEQISSLCGTQFVGKSVFPEDPGDDWRDQVLVAHIESCTADEIRIPLIVGENRSRTWILRRVEGGIELKHDHRHEDGTPDEVTMYGGTTQSDGSNLAQSFPADAYTAELIPAASTNEWFISFNEDATKLTYYLERNDLPRFKAVLLKR